MQLQVVTRAALLLAVVAGCGSSSGADVSWRFADAPGAMSAWSCAERGVNAVRIEAFDEAGLPVGPQDFACAPGRGKRGLEVGRWRLRVSGVDGAGRSFTDPASGQPAISAETTVDVSGGEFTPVEVLLGRVPRCANRMDDDGDGLVDLADAGCTGGADDDESGGAPPAPASARVAWTFSGGIDGCGDAAVATVRVDLGAGSAVEAACADGAVVVPSAEGEARLAAVALDSAGWALSRAVTRPVTLVRDRTAEVEVDFGAADWLAPRAGELRFALEWGEPAAACAAANPPVSLVRLALRASGLPVVARTDAGQPLDGTTAAACAASPARVAELPAGDYLLEVTGLDAGGAACFDARFGVTVGVGANPELRLGVPALPAAGCAP